jgi:hypothetical protein
MIARAISIGMILTALGGRSGPAAPWNNSGHRIVSFLAWSKLTEPARVAVAKLLAAHPRFEADLQVGLPANCTAMDAARHAFALASNWPDTVRSASHPMHRVANHPAWHYIDIPFVTGDRSAAGAAPAQEAARDEGPKNIVEALEKNLRDLTTPSLPAADRAIALCWVVHLIEDVHQPLHACTLYSAQFPEGDKGGNSFVVLRTLSDRNSKTNLHSLWDSLLGNYQLQAMENCVAVGIGERPAPPDLAALVAVRDPAVWAKESHDVAAEYAYLKGELVGAAEGADVAKVPPVPSGYLAAAEGVAMQRAVLAANRLADTLNRIFDPK